MIENIPLWPARASHFANNVDLLFIFLLLVTGFFTLLIFGVIAYFAVKYRSAPDREVTQIEGSYALEATWTLIPFAIFMVMFVWGAAVYMQEVQPPKNAMEIFVVGKQWMWKLQHPEGVREINALHIPVGQDVKLTMVSQDVIHSFFVPAFRIKQDVLPGRYTSIWFHATKTGHFDLFCAEYCGTLHSGMIGEVVVMDRAEYAQWLSAGVNGGAGDGSMASNGQKIFAEKGCATCHRSETQGRGPTLAGLYGKPVLLDNGRTVVADDNYLRESILNPGAQVVNGFRPIMPTFQGIIQEDELLSVLAYIKSLSPPPPGGTSVKTAAASGPDTASEKVQ